MDSSLSTNTQPRERSAFLSPRIPGVTFLLKAPSIAALLLWSLVPLAMTIWFSLQRYNLLQPTRRGFDGLGNYKYFFSDPHLLLALWNTALLVGAVLAITIAGGTLLAVLFQEEFAGRGVARLLALAPFFVMPTVSALVWKDLLMHPDAGILAFVMRSAGLRPIDWFGVAPLTSIIVILSWQWIPFSFLTLLTALQSLDSERIEAARIDGAGPIATFRYITLPYLSRAITAVMMIESIFLLGMFAEIYVTTSGGPGFASTNLSFLIYRYALLEYDVGAASVGGVIAIIVANLLAWVMMRAFARNLDR